MGLRLPRGCGARAQRPGRRPRAVDLETEGGRRFFGVDGNGGRVEYVSEMEAKPLPPVTPIGRKDALAAYDTVWEAFDEGYAGFGLLPDVDWKALGREHRELVEDARDAYALGAVLGELLTHLDDLHVSVRVGQEWIPMRYRERPLNGNWNATKALVGETHRLSDHLVWGRTPDGIGYLGVHGLGVRELPDQVDRALEELADTWALVADLRFNGGGDEPLGRAVAGRFLEEEVVYSRNRYRNGPDHDDLGPLLDRTVAPRGPWRYAAPLVVLQGRRTLSSAESLALMLAQAPGAVTMGAPTGGSSGNPTLIELECGIVVRQPRWLDLTPEGEPIEHVGVPPDVPVEAATFDDRRDRVLDAALEHLRAIPEEQRAPGKR